MDVRHWFLFSLGKKKKEKSDTIFTSPHDISGFLRYLAKGKAQVELFRKDKGSFSEF